MFKKFIGLILSFVLVLSNSYVVFAIPEVPNLDGLSTEEANVLIEQYNQEVEAYNKELKEEFGAAVAAVAEHNAHEEEEVTQNQQDIDAYNNIQNKIIIDATKGIPEHRVYQGSDLPNSWDGSVSSGAAATIKLEFADQASDEKYRIINLHLFLDEDYIDTYYGTDVRNNEFYIDENTLDHTILGEWEIVEADANDIVTVISISEAMGFRSAAFYRNLEGYTNGYWMPQSTEFVSLCEYSYPTWYKGAAQEFSYIDGATHGDTPVNVFSLYTYGFTRLGEEPIEPQVYTPDYWDDPAEPTYLAPLELLSTEPAIEPETPTTEPAIVDPPGNEDPTTEPGIIDPPEEEKPTTEPAIVDPPQEEEDTTEPAIIPPEEKEEETTEPAIVNPEPEIEPTEPAILPPEEKEEKPTEPAIIDPEPTIEKPTTPSGIEENVTEPAIEEPTSEEPKPVVEEPPTEEPIQPKPIPKEEDEEVEPAVPMDVNPNSNVEEEKQEPIVEEPLPPVEEEQQETPVIEEKEDKEVEEQEEDIISDEIPQANVVVPPVIIKTNPIPPEEEVEEQEEEIIEQETTNVGEEDEEIEDSSTPLTNVEGIEPEEEEPKMNASWALINLILMICTALALLNFSKEKKYNIISIILAVISILVFVFTEHTNNPMVLVDKWTIVMAILYVIMVISRIFSPKDKEEVEEEATEEE